MSLISGENVFKSAISCGFEAYKVIVLETREWVFNGTKISETDGILRIKNENGLVFPIIHGTYGEDGTLQRLLETAKVRFVGSKSSSTELTINKDHTGNFLSERGIRVPKSFTIGNISQIVNLPIQYPLIVKPKNEGSSISLHKVANESELRSVLKKELSTRTEILVQEFIAGREFTCGVVDFGFGAEPLVPSEIILTKGELFDYDAKYRTGGCIEVTPAEVNSEIFERTRTMALLVHEMCECRDLSRTDMILNRDDELVILEINTIPGMTGTSFIPAQLSASGHSLEDFVRAMVQKYDLDI